MTRTRNTSLKKRPPVKKEFTRQKEAMGEITDQLHDLDKHCRSMIVNAGQLAPLLLNTKIIDAGDTERIHDQAKIFSEDLLNMSQGLDLITMQIPKKIKPNNTDQLSNALRLSHAYAEWQDRYQDVLVPTIEALTRLLSEAVDAWSKSNPGSDPASVQSTVDNIESGIREDLRQLEISRTDESESSN